MSDLAMLVYLAEILPRLGGASVFIAFIFLFYPIIYMMGAVMGDFKKSRVVSVTISSIAAVLFTGVAIAIPTTKTIYLMAGGQVATSAVSTPEFNKVRAIINGKLDDMLADPYEMLEPVVEAEEGA